MIRTHADKEYETELGKVRQQLLMMGAKVEEMLDVSLMALRRSDARLAEKTILMDSQIDKLEMDIDELCLKILAKRQPVASDLRFVTMALKIVVDLERMGDLNVNICERIVELSGEEALMPYVEMMHMAQAAQVMLRDALDAFVAADIHRAQAVIERDLDIDAYYKTLFRTLLTYMMENPRNIYRATRIQSIAKYIERMADHATNLAEMVVFMVGGKDIRHRGRSAKHRSDSLDKKEQGTPGSRPLLSDKEKVDKKSKH